MSKCCKCAKWFPHNWLCLKGLSIIFLVLFYFAVVYAVFQTVSIIAHPQIAGQQMWSALLYFVGSDLAAALGFLTISKIIKALHKIKKAVAPCCCAQEETVEEAASEQEESK